jgi:hypothetical protein
MPAATRLLFGLRLRQQGVLACPLKHCMKEPYELLHWGGW